MKGVGPLELYNKHRKNFQTTFVFKQRNVKTMQKDQCLLYGKGGERSFLRNNVLLRNLAL